MSAFEAKHEALLKEDAAALIDGAPVGRF